MARCSVFIATSVDGYIARENGDISWLEIVHPVDEAHGYAAFFASIDTIVVGRGTYDVVLGFADYPYAGKRVIVMTHRPAELRPGVELFAGTPSELVARLGDSHVYVDGANVISQFFAANLIDDVTLSIVPIVLGGGIRLFSGGEGEHRLELTKQLSWPSGLVQHRYRVVRPT
ncbi:MAG TPA: dihydrofolate reductase family protein [Kofleriaceae bacterium]